MGEKVICRECGVEIEISGAISDDTVVFCDECGAEYNPISDVKQAFEMVRGDTIKKLAKATRGANS